MILQEHKAFSPLTVPLSGTQLIEASAGTGKTHAITDLYLRLLLETKNLSVNQILVVTFTEAATEELRDRTRKKLRAAFTALSIGGSTGDRGLDEMLSNYSDRALALQILQQALANFDESAIFTIHGFCHRLLRDQAYESGTLFDTELITSQENLVREVVFDFWRKHFYQASRLLVSHAIIGNQNEIIRKKYSPDYLLKLVSRYIHNPTIQIIPPPVLPDTIEAEQAFLQAFKNVSSSWSRSKAEVIKNLISSNTLKRTTYKVKNIEQWSSYLDRYLSLEVPDALPPGWFEKLTPSALVTNTKKGMKALSHPFFELCEDLYHRSMDLLDLFDRCLLALEVSLFEYVRKELNKKKHQQNVQYFDDLLMKVHESLTNRGGDYLARNIRGRFKAALIDEFQDTDPIQYEIFKKIFIHKDTTLFLIGDPKQAIYSFRSADVFAYMQAADSVKNPYTLNTNWRSEPGLIHAVNTLFTYHQSPFLFDKIKFGDASPSSTLQEQLTQNGRKVPPFHLWFFRAGKEQNRISPINKPDISRIIAGSVANEIVRLLNLAGSSNLCIGDRAIETGDIAILVRTHDQARMMQQELSERSVPCILHSAGYLFESHEAKELERVLTGIANPNDERLVKAALATDIMGLTGQDLLEFSAYETQWEKRLIAFRNYHQMWNRDGFFRMFRQLMVQEHVKERLIRLPNGERRLTNLLHLAEELHRQSGETNLGMRGLGKWLAEQIDSASPNLEEHLLRLESDEDAVKILTIHKSKGLEYPIVFCPFHWGNSDVQGNEVLFHDNKDVMQLKLDLGSQDQEIHRKYASEECLSENMRLLYVALTRAKNRCYFVWGGFKGAETSAPAYLFHNRDRQKEQAVIQTTKENFKALSDDGILNDLKRYEDFSEDAILVYEVSEEEPICYSPPSVSLKVPLSSRTFANQVEQEWRVVSFSSLVSGRMHEPEFPDSDEFAFDRQEIPRPQSEQADHFILPAGAKTGTMLHDILEHLDFTNTDDLTLESVVFEKIKAYGYDAQWHASICTMMQNVLSVPLEPDENGFTLSHIQKKDRVSELGFYFPLRPISKKLLMKIFSEFASQELLNNFPMIIEDLTFSPVQGFMKGFIDLVFCNKQRFYLVDWKSNLLGVDPEDYRRDNLQWIMEKNYYILQYHIYTLALHQYLSVRVPEYRYEKHFGGVYYIFLRGVEPALGPAYGIYYDRPSERIIQKMHTRLLQWIN